MALSITHNNGYSYRNKYSSCKNTPFELFLSGTQSKNMIFSYSEHHGPDITEFMYFIPDDPECISGVFYYDYQGDTTNYEIVARIIINKYTQTIYIQNVIIDYFQYFYGGDPDLKFIGGIKALKHLPEGKAIITEFVNLFFGPNFRFHMGFKKSHQKKIINCFAKRYKQFDLSILIDDIKEYIIKKITTEYLNIPNVSFYDLHFMENLVKKYNGAKCPDNEWGYYYNWGIPLSIYY